LAPDIRTPLHEPDIGSRLLFYREGRLSTVSVVENVAGSKTLHIDKIPVAGTDAVMMTDQKSLAHVPMLLHPLARHALTVGFGSGGASWSFTRYSRLRQVDSVEIDPTVLEAASHFRESHHDVFADPRFRLILDDARSFLQRTDRTYDIISTDCTDLRYKSNAMLYTREYFQLCRRRLNPGGLTVVWLPLGGLSNEDLRVAIATFRDVFPSMSVWYMNNVPAHYVLLVGGDRDVPINVANLREQLTEETVAEDLAEIGLADPWKIVTGFLFGADAAARFTAGASINTDARPILEFSVPRGGFSGFTITRNLLSLLRERHTPPVRTATDGDRDAFDAYWRAADRLIRGHAIFQRGNHDYQATLDYYRAAEAINPGDRQTRRLVDDVRATESSWRRVLERRLQDEPTDVSAHIRLGLLNLSQGNATTALAQFDAAARLDADNWQSRFNQGRAHEEMGAFEQAEEAYRAAVAINPRAAMAQTNLGLLLLKRNW
jgi:spermidine synthase